MIKKGADFLHVEANILIKKAYLNNILNNLDDFFKNIFENEKGENVEIIVSRKIDLSGKNICKINRENVRVNELNDFMLKILDIHRTK